MYAIIETGGKQYRVTPGDVISLENLSGNVGDKVTFDKVLLVGGKSDNKVLVGAPYVPKASLEAEIVDQASRGEKLLTIKYKRRKGYRRTIGHRQEQTRVLFTKLLDGAGQSLQFDTANRTEVLKKASVPFSTRQARHQEEFKAKKASGSAKKTKTATKAKKQ